MDSENDAIYVPLKKGRNERVLAVSELGGGWGFVCRLTDLLRRGTEVPAEPRTRTPT